MKHGGIIADMRVAFVLLVSPQAARYCTVVEPSVKDAVKQAEIVFRGRITEISESTITFRVERVEGACSCRFCDAKAGLAFHAMHARFLQGHVSTGAELLVYARRMPGADGTRYVSGADSRTAPVQNATEDLKKLGTGRWPTSCVIRRPAARERGGLHGSRVQSRHHRAGGFPRRIQA